MKTWRQKFCTLTTYAVFWKYSVLHVQTTESCFDPDPLLCFSRCLFFLPHKVWNFVFLLDCFHCCLPPFLQGFMAHSESMETEVLSHFVFSHLCVADVGLSGEIGYDVFAIIVWENLQCNGFFPFNPFPCTSVDLCEVCWWDHVFPACYHQTFLSIQCETSHLVLGCFCVCLNARDGETYGCDITLLWSLLSSPNCFTITQKCSSVSGPVTAFKVCSYSVSHSFSKPEIFWWCHSCGLGCPQEWAGIPPIVRGTT